VDNGKNAANKTRGTHDFVFLWACMHGDSNWVGNIAGGHSWGMLASLMDINNPSNQLSNDAYAYPDYNSTVFISFDFISPWYTQSTQNPPFNYGHFVYKFYDYLLQGYTVNGALNAASQYVNNGVSYGSSQLRNGLSVWNPVLSCWNTTHMRVWGDGTYKTPR
jgi:hypothetical protein